MTSTALIDAVRQAGGTLKPNGDRLRVEAPQPLPANLVDALRAHKKAILAELDATARLIRERRGDTRPYLPQPPGQTGMEPWRQEIATWSDAQKEGWEERAAIMQFDAKLPRADAEWFAYLDCRGLFP